MLDPALLRTQPADLAARLKQTRGYDLNVADLLLLETERKQIQVRTQELQNLRNTKSKQIGMLKAKGEDVSAVMAEVAAFGVETMLADDHRTVVPGWSLSTATAISDDGRTIAGQGIGPAGVIEGWIVRLPPD